MFYHNSQIKSSSNGTGLTNKKLMINYRELFSSIREIYLISE